jgi:protocatechuate 3,4-dioxygenase, beta subunit
MPEFPGPRQPPSRQDRPTDLQHPTADLKSTLPTANFGNAREGLGLTESREQSRLGQHRKATMQAMNPIHSFSLRTRRHFLQGLGLGSALFLSPGAFAAALVRTPPQTEGPFYPDKLPLDTDNDLIILNDNLTPAVGEITWLSGRILDARREPIRNALVEIWQCDNNGAYLHTKTGNAEKRDRNFQGFGRFLTGSTGEYLFRTIKPVPYPGRTPHIHMAVKMKGRKELVTQCYIKDHPANEKDGIWRSITDEKARNAVTIPFRPLKGSRTGELAARFDVVMGLTPEA